MEFYELLDEDLNSEMKKLRETRYDDKAYVTVSDTVSMLMDKKIEMEKLKSEQLFKEQQLEEEKKDRFIKNIINVAGVVLPLAVTIWGTKVSLKFEEEGTFTTIMGRGFINKLLPKK
jgi:ABC-type sugar transport system ATPase subunit